MELAHPGFLIFALVIVWLGFVLRRSLADMKPAQRRACLFVRSILILLIVLALAGARWIRNDDQMAVIYLMDRSASISDEAAKQAETFVTESLKSRKASDLAGVIGFAEEAKVWQPLSGADKTANWKLTGECGERSKSDLGGAMDFAASVFPSERLKRLVILTDGNDTEGRAREAAARLSASGVEVLTVPLRNPKRPEVLVSALNLPASLREGEPFDLEANIWSSVATTVKSKLYQNQFLVGQQEFKATPGQNRIVFPNLKSEGGFASYELEIAPAEDTIVENNRATASTSRSGQPRVLVVDSEEGKLAAFVKALQDENIQVEVRNSNGLPNRIDELQRFDLFVLSDVPALSIGRERMEVYQRWVRELGGGFLMLGGENSYGVGGYFKTPIERMLPVRMEHDDRQETPTVALLVILDRSGSMSSQVQGQTKMALANQGAVFALDVLQARDYFGVFAVDTRVHPVVPVGRVSNKAVLEQKILSITAGGGGIYIFTSLSEALRSLRGIDAKIKHVILFSDSADAEEKFAGERSDGTPSGGSALDLASTLLSNRITTSVVALGYEQDRDTAFLKLLAERGNGRFYLTNDALNLPQIFSTETMKVAQSSLIEEPFSAQPVMASPITSGIDWSTAPFLLGYNATKLKPTAQVLLGTEFGEPLFATWRYGLGQAGAFTSDAKARWASEWLQWPGFGKFWVQAVRGLMRKSDAANLQVTTEERGDRLHVGVDALAPDGSFRNRIPVSVAVLDEEGEPVTVPAQQTAPGHYEANVNISNATSGMLVSVSAPEVLERPYVLGVSRSYPKEYLSFETNEALLKEVAGLAGGQFAPAGSAAFAPSTRTAQQPFELSGWLLAAAALLLPLDIYLRRRSWA